MPGTAEAGDLFGAAVTQLGTLVAVGAPKQDVGTARDTGQVHLISWTKRCGAAEVSARLIHQDGTGVPSVNESGDTFGAALATQTEISTSSGTITHRRLLIGSPGEDLGSISDTGFVTVVTDPTLSGTLTSLALRQGDGLPGTAEAGDRVGAALGAPGHPRTSASAITSGAWVSAPGEDIAGVADAGVVAVTTTWPAS